MLSIVYYGVSIIVLLYILGYGLTLLILPKTLQKYSFWLIPWVAIIFLIFSLVTLSLAGLSVSVAGPLAIGVLIILDFWVILKTSLRLTVSLKELLLVATVMGMVFVLGAYPLLRHERYLTTISLGNNDASVYALTSDYFVNNSINEFFRIKQDLLFYPAFNGLSNLILHGYRWGMSLLLAFFLSVLHLKGYQLEYLMQVILFILCIPLVYVLMQLLHRSSMIALIFALIIFGFNANLLYILYHNFFGQVLFWGISLFLFIGFYSYFFSDEEKKHGLTKYDIILGLTIGVLYFFYHEVIVFIFPPLIVLLILRCIGRKGCKNYWKALIKILLVVVPVSSVSGIHAVVIDLLSAADIDAPIGWSLFRSRLPYANPFEMMGFYSIHSFEPLPFFVALILTTLVIGVLILGFYKSHKKLITISFLCIYLLFYVWTSILHHNFFAFNRVVTYTLPLIIVLFVIGIDELYKKRKKIMSCIIIALICLELFSAIKLMRRFVRERIVVDKSLISLKQLKNAPIHDEPIYIEQVITGFQNYWVQTWTEYFLYPEFIRIYSPQNFDLSKNKIPDNSLILVSRGNRYYQSAQLLFKNIVWKNEYYILGRICSSDRCLQESDIPLSSVDFQTHKYQDSLLISGWSLKEDGHRWINDKKATLRLVAGKNPAGQLHISALTLQKPQKMTVYVNEKKIGVTSMNTEWDEYIFDIGIHQNKILNIRFEFDHLYNPATLGLNTDERDLAVNIRKISLE